MKPETVPPVIFVCGSMRSGTSLLQQVICSSPDCNAFINGARYLMDQVQLYVKYNQQDQLYVDDYLGSMDAYTRFTSDLLGNVLSSTWHQQGKPAHLCLKNPELSFYIDFTRLLIPQSRFVFSVRDPRDVVTSMIQVGDKFRKDGIDSPLARAGRNLQVLCNMLNNHYRRAAMLLANGQMQAGKDILFVRYEDLVLETATALDNISSFCGITIPHPGQQQWTTSDSVQQIGDDPRWKHYLTELSGKPISADSIGKYKDILSNDETAFVEQQCLTLRQQFGYL